MGLLDKLKTEIKSAGQAAKGATDAVGGLIKGIGDAVGGKK